MRGDRNTRKQTRAAPRARPRWRGHRALALAWVLTLTALAPPAAAQSVTGLDGDGRVRVEAPAPQSESALRETPALLQADEITYDEDERVVSARGSVEISQGERIVLADRVSYDLDRDVIIAEGDVSLLQPTGDVAFADRVELTGDLEEGALRAFRLLMSDRTRLAAASAVRTRDNRTEMRKAVFSPCELCREDPEAAPLWQLRAERVVHDEDEQTIFYRDTTLELFGVPVFYTPYFEHPDPTVERQTGFLAPTVGSSDELGLTFQQPFYWAIDRSSDLTLSPIFTTEEGVVGLGTYRRHTGNGRFDLTLSGTQGDLIDDSGQLKRDQFRGHIDTRGRFDINRAWRWGFDLERSTDDTYLRVYDLETDGDRFLEGELFAERFEGRRYFSAQAFTWQGLRRGDENDELPFVLPETRYSFVGEPGVAGGVLRAEASALNLFRRDGRDSRRVSGTLGWNLPYIDQLGGRLELKTAVQLDAYAYEDVDPSSNQVDPPPGQREDGTELRAFPQIALAYGYPVVRHSRLGSEVLEPKVQVVAGPNGGNPGEIPNEDSRALEFDADNLFALNRFPGRDRVSSGQRIDYGLSYTYTTPSGGGTASAFLGQSYRFESDSALPEFVGEDASFSDIVGSLQVSPIRYVDAVYRFRADTEPFDLNRTEVNLAVGPPALNLNLDYSLLDRSDTRPNFQQREEIAATLRTRFARYWSAFASHRRDLQDNEGLRTAFGVSYHDECFLLNLTAERRQFRDRDLEPETRVLVTFALKHLGGVGGN
jgi:LPS-assembly protein